MNRQCVRVALGGLIASSVLACQGPPTDPRTERFAALPDWSGMWVSAEPIGVIDVSGYPEGFNAITDWKVIGAMAPLNEAVRAKLSNAPSSAATFKAASWGFPLMMESPTPLQFLITPEETLILNFYRDARHVYTDGRDLPPTEDRWPGPWGESVGRWEGDTLVIDTVSADSSAVLGGLPFPVFSTDAVYRERMRLVSPDRIESEISVSDPATLSDVWVFRVAFKRAASIDRMFHMPFENDRTTPGTDGLLTIAPTTAQ
jgi:hypothetical protein